MRYGILARWTAPKKKKGSKIGFGKGRHRFVNVITSSTTFPVCFTANAALLAICWMASLVSSALCCNIPVARSQELGEVEDQINSFAYHQSVPAPGHQCRS